MAADGPLPHAVRGKAGHVYFPRSAIPTWTECVGLLKEQRDRHLRRAASALRRLDTELEAVRNDITEAREFPQQTLGIDLMSFGHWPHDRMASSCAANRSSPACWSSSPPSGWRSRAITTPIRTLWRLRDGSPGKARPDPGPMSGPRPVRIGQYRRDQGPAGTRVRPGGR